MSSDLVQRGTPPNSVVSFSFHSLHSSLIALPRYYSNDLIGQGFDDGVDTVWLPSNPNGEKTERSVFCVSCVGCRAAAVPGGNALENCTNTRSLPHCVNSNFVGCVCCLSSNS